MVIEVTLSDYKGKKLLVNFGQPGVHHVRKKCLLFNNFQRSGEDMIVLAVNIDPENDVVAFANEHKLTFPILLDHKRGRKNN